MWLVYKTTCFWMAMHYLLFKLVCTSPLAHVREVIKLACAVLSKPIMRVFMHAYAACHDRLEAILCCHVCLCDWRSVESWFQTSLWSGQHIYCIAGKFGGELDLAVWWSILQPPIKIRKNFLLAYMYIRMVIPYRTANLNLPIFLQ